MDSKITQRLHLVVEQVQTIATNGKLQLPHPNKYQAFKYMYVVKSQHLLALGCRICLIKSKYFYVLLA